MSRLKIRHLGVLATGLAVVMLIAPDDADARRRGSFGSRGARTYDAPATTTVAPNQTAPVQRSMTERPASNPASDRAAQTGRPASAKSGGVGKGLIGGLIAGGLIGALLGGGLGSLAGAGMLMALLQALLIGAFVWFLFRMFRRKPALAGAHGGAMQSSFAGMNQQGASLPQPSQSFAGAAAASPVRAINLSDADRHAFERLLIEVQDAFGKEDYARLRERTTPEVMSYFAEELSQNATRGQRNEVVGTELIEAEVAEAWQEGSTDYATVAMRYESVDLMLDRSTGAVIEGDRARPTQATELWTFKREPNGPWRLSAIQET